MAKAKKAIKAVFLGAATGAAQGAVAGATEAGTKAAGIPDEGVPNSSTEEKNA